MEQRRPYSGSCAVCRELLGLASVRYAETWYCSTACAEGRPAGEVRHTTITADKLSASPRRFFGRRRPKELRDASGV